MTDKILLGVVFMDGSRENYPWIRDEFRLSLSAGRGFVIHDEAETGEFVFIPFTAIKHIEVLNRD